MRLFKNLLTLARWAFVSERGVFSITNFNFAVRDSSFLPAVHNEIADLTMLGGTVTDTVNNTGIVGLKWIRMRAICKALTNIAAGDSVTVTVQAGTSTAITNPTNICQQTVVMKTGDTALLFEQMGWSNAGFQSYKVIIDSSTATASCVTDVLLDMA